MCMFVCLKILLGQYSEKLYKYKISCKILFYSCNSCLLALEKSTRTCVCLTEHGSALRPNGWRAAEPARPFPRWIYGEWRHRQPDITQLSTLPGAAPRKNLCLPNKSLSPLLELGTSLGFFFLPKLLFEQ